MIMIIIYVYQLGTRGCTQEAKSVRNVYPQPREPINNGLTNTIGWVKEKNSTPKPDLQPTGHPVAGQAPHLAARPGEAAKREILMDVMIIIYVYQLGTGGRTQEAGNVNI